MQNQSQKSIFEKLFDLSIGISCMIILVVAVVSVGSSIMVPKNDVELMQAWEKSYNRMCTKIMKDAEKGKEKEVTEYRMYYLVKGDYWGNLEKEMFYYEAQSASMELNMGLAQPVLRMPFNDVYLAQASPSSKGFTNIQFLESKVEAKDYATSILFDLCQDRWDELETIELHLTEKASYITKDENFEKNLMEKHTQEAWSCMVGEAVKTETVCAGYARAVYMLCQEREIPCICVKGTLNGGNHLWNLVYVDGQWLHLDVTNTDLERENQRTFMDYMENTKWPENPYLKMYEDEMKYQAKRDRKKAYYYLVDEETAHKKLTYNVSAIAVSIEALYPELLEDYLKQIES